MAEYLGKINVLTQAQYDIATKNENELYLIIDDTSTISVTSVTVTPSIASIVVGGGTQQLTVTISPSNATNQNVTWSTSNSAIATVSSTGLVTAVSAGSATITCTSNDNGLSAMSNISVTTTSTTITDTFTRVDNTTTLGNTDTGQAWSILSGTWGISSNKAYLPVISTGTKIAVVESGYSDNITISCDMYYSSSSDSGLAFRVADTSNYIQLTLNGAQNHAYIKKIVNGTATDVFDGATTLTINSTVNLKVELNGTTIKTYLNNILLTTVVISELSTNTKHGLKYYIGTNITFDNFEVKAI